MAKTGVTTIQISKEIREELKAIGSKGETYDEIIRRLLQHKNKSKKGDK